MKKILICTDLIISNFFSETNLNVFQIHNNWNTYFINNIDDVMNQNEKNFYLFLFFSITPHLVLRYQENRSSAKRKEKQ